MKKVRLFAVAAAMGMFASTVAAAEPVVSTGYTTTWEGVEEIIKVDVGNKVVAPVTTIKVVKETRTTDSEYDVTSDALGFEEDANCLTSTGAAKDDNGDNYSDVQMFVNFGEVGYYTSQLDAVKDYLYDNNLIIAPNAEETKDDAYYAKYANLTFADYEEAYAWLEEQGLVESVYDEDGDLTKIYVKSTTITDYKGREIANARYEIEVNAREEEETKEAIVKKCVTGEGTLTGKSVALPNYTADEAKNVTYSFAAYVDGAEELTYFGDNTIVIVDEYKGELNVLGVYESSEDALAAGYITGWTKAGDEIGPKVTEDKVTVYSVVSKKGEVVKLATVTPSKVKAYTPYATMVWDEVAGSFVKTVEDYSTDYFNGEGYVSANGTDAILGFWNGHEHTADEGDAKAFGKANLYIKEGTLGLTNRPALLSVENPSDKYLLDTEYVALNTKEEKMTLSYNDGKEVVVNAVEIERGVWLPAFDSEETLIKVAAKLDAFETVGVKFDNDTKNEALEGADYSALFESWYEATEDAIENVWSGFDYEGDLPENELQGAGSEACSYVVSVESETVDATVEASEVDTTVAGVKTMTLSAKVDGEVVATKDVKVVVAPRYERTYVNGKVAVLKSFYLDGTLYSEYHYDWAAKTYTATFYANDGVTVASTANGTL